jgi:hypothetical protein
MTKAAKHLRHATLERSGAAKHPVVMKIQGDMTLAKKSCQGYDMTDGADWSTFFVAASIVESSAKYKAEAVAEKIDTGVLISALDHNDKRVHLIDGGFVDSSGIVAQLQQGVRNIFAVYVVNDCLKHNATSTNQCSESTLAYLFGKDVPADSMNSISGPELNQVFETSLWDGVLSNLTNASRLMVSLQNVKVLENSYLGITSYTVDQLMILSNARSDEFVNSFKDHKIKKHLSKKWPDRLPVSMDSFHANMMCHYQWWKLEQHADAIKDFFPKTSVTEMLV